MPQEEIIPVAGAPAGVAVADAAALVAENNRLNAELASARAQTAKLADADRAAHKAAAINAALAGAPLINNPAAVKQLGALLDREITLTTDPATGRQVAVGPNLVPAETHIRSLLQTSDFSHFLRAQNPNGGTAGSTGAQSAPTPTLTGWGNAEPPPATLSEAIIRQAQATTRGQAPAFGVDVSKPFGLGPKR
jgi:hypothetical protein